MHQRILLSKLGIFFIINNYPGLLWAAKIRQCLQSCYPFDIQASKIYCVTLPHGICALVGYVLIGLVDNYHEGFLVFFSLENA